MAPRLLILSFSSIAGDARVLKQVRLFAERYEVTTCGFGPAPEGVVEHVRLGDEHASLTPYGRYVTLRWYRAAYGAIPAVRAARAALRGRAPFDAALANDVEAVPVALEHAAAGRVHADLHEYTPRLHEDHAPWARWLAPFYRWLCRRYVRRAASVSTVGAGLAEAYRSELGITAEVVTNAAPYAELDPTAVAEPLRLVHSGAALRNRDLGLLLEAVALTRTPVELDLFLMPNDPAYIAELATRAAEVGGVRVLDPVPYADLVATLNGYDVGVHVLPPVNFNNANALPNKVFDYVQARLGLVVGPTPEMAMLVRERGIGVAADEFTAASLAAVLDELTPATVRSFKEASHAAARDLSAAEQVRGWERAVDRLMTGRVA